MNFRMRKCFEALGLRWSRTRERGATALFIALCLLLVMAAAAASFDTANLALRRQKLQNLTDAAAQAGAVYLRDNPKDLAGAQQAAFAFAYSYDKHFELKDVSLWCIVGSTGATKTIAPGNIPTVCDPITYTGQVCDQNLCAIPIPTTTSGASANAIQVYKNELVDFYFAPAIGINNAYTGAVASISCAKACGSGGKPNPLDVAIIADRTPSMTDTDFNAMKSGIEASLQTMTPEYQLATIGTIHRSNAATTNACKTSLGPPVTTTTSGSGWNQVTTYKDGGSRDGRWLPLAQGNQTSGFSNSYLTGTLGSTGRTLIKTSDLGYQVDCMDHYYKTSSSGYPWGTHLAAPLKAAARLLLGKDPSNLGALSTQRASLLTGGASVKQWIIFETDGYPEETMGLNSTAYDPAYKDSILAPTTAAQILAANDLGNTTEPSAPGNPGQGCKNLIDVAANAKAQGIGIIMIAYGNATTSTCGTQGTVASVMAKAASPVNSSPSLADKSCTSTGGQPAPENADGDYFFCASTAADLANIFKTAIGMTSSPNTKYVQMPK